MRQFGVRLAFAAVGFAPIFALALSLTGATPLHLGAPLLLGMALLAGGCLAVSNPWCRPAVSNGLGAGLLAVLIYDGTRLAFMMLAPYTLSLMGHLVYGTVLGLCLADQLRRRPFSEIR